MRRKEDARRWLQFTKEDLEAATVMEEKGYRRIAVFLLQQSAEKSLKAVVIILGLEGKVGKFKTHDIGHLVDVLIEEDVPMPPDVLNSPSLTRYAFTTRYPDDYIPVSLEEYEEAYEIAVKVYEWAKGIVESQP